MLKRHVLLWIAVIAANGCAPAGSSGGGGGGSTKPKPSTTGDVTPDNNGQINTPSGTSALTGEAKCWTKMLETPAYQACKAQNKIYNRIKNVCVELGMTRSNDCSAVKAADIQTANNDILTKLPKAYLTVDQCATYSLNGKTYTFAYLLGQRYFEDKNPEGQPVGYKIQAKTLCYRPDTGNIAADAVICNNAQLKVSDAAPAMPANLGTCD